MVFQHGHFTVHRCQTLFLRIQTLVQIFHGNLQICGRAFIDHLAFLDVADTGRKAKRHKEQQGNGEISHTGLRFIAIDDIY